MVVSLQMYVFLCFFRCGEAKNPGPIQNHQEQWKFGIFNPSGLNSKLDQVGEMEGEVWVASETHLTAQGLRWFKNGLKASKSRFQYVVGGFPCKPQTHTDIGNYSGVAAIASVPLRALPHQFTPELFKLSRSQVVGFAIGPLWIQAGIVYGFPDSSQHKERTFQTECILAEVVMRVGQQASGPRIVAGDMNHGPQQLQSLQMLHSLGFREAQQYAAAKWGVPIRNTTAGSQLIDQIWLSPELLAILERVDVLDVEWADHSSVQCTFNGNPAAVLSHVWRMPSQASWPEQFRGSVSVDWCQCPTVAYASYWNQLEEQAGIPFENAKGRGKTLDTTPKNFVSSTMP